MNKTRIPIGILVVDPDLGVRTQAKRSILEYPWAEVESDHCLSVESAGSVEEANLAIRRTMPDVVLITVRVPQFSRLDPLPHMFWIEKSPDFEKSKQAQSEEQQLLRNSFNGIGLGYVCVQVKTPYVAFFPDKVNVDPISSHLVESFFSQFEDIEKGTIIGETTFMKGAERGNYTAFLDDLLIQGVKTLAVNHNRRLIVLRHYAYLVKH